MKKRILIFVIFNFNFLFGQINNKETSTLDIEKVKSIKSEILDSLKKVSKQSFTTLVVEYDYKTGRFLNDELKPKHKQPVVLKIINLNKIAFNTDIICSDIKVNDEFLNPSEQKATKIIDENKKTEEILRPILNTDFTATFDIMKLSANNASKAVNQKVKTDNKVDEIDKKINELNFEIKSNEKKIENKKTDLEKIKVDIDKIKTDTLSVNKEINEVRINKLNIKIVDINDEIDDIKAKILNDEVQLEIEETQKKIFENKRDVLGDIVSKFNEYANELVISYTKIQRNTIEINKLNSAYYNYMNFISNPELNHFSYCNSKKICVVWKNDKQIDYQNVIKDFEKDYLRFITKYNEITNNSLFFEVLHQYESYGNLIKLKLENIKNEVEEINKLVNVNELRKKLNNVQILDEVLSEKSSFEIISAPIQGFEDYIDFKVSIVQNIDLGNSIVKQKPRLFSYKEYIRNGVRWDFSLGTVFDFGIKYQEYEINKDFKIVANNNSQYIPTIAGLLHASFRSNNMFAFGFSLGASIDLTSLNLNSFFPGVSLLIGKREKIIFTAGPSLRRVNQLKEKYNVEHFVVDATTQTTDLTSPQFKIGGFFGISYNLTSNQKSKFKVAN